ncbi:tyrosine-type recombinase/integrase [Mesorhizobium sp. L-2-11]|uniref:tyrosine-type recombinase/integrase n=1 Tax=Mesorhizobium sp. L-2-11 TaxID=2744521 RepID=UPI00406C753B
MLAIPSKRCDKRQLQFLTRPEIEAILACPDRSTWLGRRDHTLLLLAAQTGLRVSEIIDLDRDSVMLGHGAHVRCVGKGRKERSTPLTKVAQQALRGWLNEPRKRGATALFPNTHGGKLSADGVQALLNKYPNRRASQTKRHGHQTPSEPRRYPRGGRLRTDLPHRTPRRVSTRC